MRKSDLLDIVVEGTKGFGFFFPDVNETGNLPDVKTFKVVLCLRIQRSRSGYQSAAKINGTFSRLKSINLEASEFGASGRSEGGAE